MKNKKKPYKDQTSKIVNKLRKGQILTKEQLEYYKKFNPGYWRGLI